jgi:isochorismate pyruvate lyase
MTDAILPPDECSTMPQVRRGVDALDDRIVALLAERFRYMAAAARIKLSRDSVRDEARKAEVLARVDSHARGAGAPADAIAAVYERLIEESIAYELGRFDALRR